MSRRWGGGEDRVIHAKRGSGRSLKVFCTSNALIDMVEILFSREKVP